MTDLPADIFITTEAEDTVETTPETKDPDKETNTAPDGEKPVEEEPGNTDTSTETETKPDPDTLTISDDTMVMWTDPESGEEKPVPFHTIKGSVKFKDEYDNWINTEQKPLQETKEQFDSITEEWQHDPENFIHSHIKMINAAGLDDVVLARKTKDDYGNEVLEPYTPIPKPKKDKTAIAPEVAEQQTKIAGLETELFVERELQKVDATAQEKANIAENYKKYEQIYKAENPEDPFGAAVIMVMGSSPKQKKAPGTRVTPAKPKNPIVDKKIQALYDNKVLKQA